MAFGSGQFAQLWGLTLVVQLQVFVRDCGFVLKGRRFTTFMFIYVNKHVMAVSFGLKYGIPMCEQEFATCQQGSWAMGIPSSRMAFACHASVVG